MNCEFCDWTHATAALPAGNLTAAGPGTVPRDLRTWVSEDRLLALTLEAVAGDGGPVAREFRHDRECFPLAQLLATLAYAYLSGRAGSDEIEEQLFQDRVLDYLCAGHHPSATALRHCRRVYRDLLGNVLRHVYAAILTIPGVTGVADNRVALAAACAAATCLDRATLADTIALDV